MSNNWTAYLTFLLYVDLLFLFASLGQSHISETCAIVHVVKTEKLYKIYNKCLMNVTVKNLIVQTSYTI